MAKKGKVIQLNINVKQSEPKTTPKAKTLSGHLRSTADMLIYCVCALGLGIALGVIDAFFGTVLLKVGDIRDGNPYYFIPFLFAAGLIICFIYDRFGKETQSGMKLLFERLMSKRTEIKLRLIPFVTVSTWLTHLFGGSAGREGVAVQIGGTLGSFVSQHLKLHRENTAKIMTITGMAGGFAGLFRTPMAAIFFSSEVLNAGRLEVDALLPAMICSFTASWVSGQLGLERFTVAVSGIPEPDISTVAALCVICIIFGLTGGLFAWLMKLTKRLLSAVFKNIYLKIAVIGAIVSLLSLLLYTGRYSGLGTNLISAATGGGDIYAWDPLLKLILTILTISAGFQGGEVTPLFAIGASLGAVLGSFLGIPAVFTAALGYAAVFGAATNTLIAPMLIGVEVFGYQYMPYFFAACTIAYLANGNQSIYPQKTRLSVLK